MTTDRWLLVAVLVVLVGAVALGFLPDSVPVTLNADVALAIVAIVLSVVAMGFEVFFYVSQTKLNHDIAKENGLFAQQMQALLGEIRGMTTATQDRLASQQDKVLEAFINRGQPAAEQAVSQEASALIEQLRDELRLVAEKANASGEIEAQVAATNERLAELQSELPNVARMAARQAAREALTREESPRGRAPTVGGGGMMGAAAGPGAPGGLGGASMESDFGEISGLSEGEVALLLQVASAADGGFEPHREHEMVLAKKLLGRRLVVRQDHSPERLALSMRGRDALAKLGGPRAIAEGLLVRPSERGRPE